MFGCKKNLGIIKNKMSDIELPVTHYDAIIVGTGIEESILAGALCRAGKKVLHLDVQETYGSQYSSLNPNELESFLETREANVVDEDHTGHIPHVPFYHNPYEIIPIVSEAASTEIKEETATTEQTTTATIESSSKVINKLEKNQMRRYMIDVCGVHMIYCRGPMVELLIQSGIARYLEFRCLDVVLLFDSENAKNPFKKVCDESTVPTAVTDISDLFQAVPTTKGEIFKTKFISLKEKNRLVKFITYCMEMEGQEDKMKLFKEYENDSFENFLQKSQLLGDEKEYKKLKDITVHALALLDSSTNVTTGQVINRIKYFVSSLGRYGAGGAFLYPLYGQSELVQAFCRVGAVYGGTYVLRRGIHSLDLIENEHLEEALNQAETKPETVITETGDEVMVEEKHFSKEKMILKVGSGVQDFTCDHLILNNDTPLPSSTTSLDNDVMLKYVVITESPLFPITKNNSANVVSSIPPSVLKYQCDENTVVEQPCAIYVIQMDYTSCVTPRGKYMITFQTRVPNTLKSTCPNIEQVVTKMLDICVNSLIPQQTQDEQSIENVIYKICYKQQIRPTSSHPFEGTENELKNERIHMCHDSNADPLQMESGMIEHVKSIFRSIVKDDSVEFLAKILDPNKKDDDEENALYDETTRLLGITKDSQVSNDTPITTPQTSEEATTEVQNQSTVDATPETNNDN